MFSDSKVLHWLPLNLPFRGGLFISKNLYQAGKLPILQIARVQETVVLASIFFFSLVSWLYRAAICLGR